MSKLGELIWDKEGFEVRLHCENCFDDKAYTQIKQALKVEDARIEIQGIITDLLD